MKKSEIIDFGTAFGYCFEQAKKNVIKTLTIEDEDEIMDCLYFKPFCKMHPQIDADKWEIIKDNAPLFTRRLEYFIAANHI